jgi:pimeloyl-ACP methyl ester carboxylesterase
VALGAIAALIAFTLLAARVSLAVEPSPGVSAAIESGSTTLSTASASIVTVPINQPWAFTVHSIQNAASSADRTPTTAVSLVEKPSTQTKFRLAAMRWLNRSGQRPTTQFGIQLASAIGPARSERPIVILIHGYNSSPERMTPLCNSISAAGYECGTFAYPNDQAIVDSAELLSRELVRLRQLYPNRKIALVTHSMGGLVARDVIENPALDPGNVTQLIMIAPPSQGTSCAYIVWSGDLWEHFLHTRDHNLLNDLYASLEDGLGEGREDLKPESDFLHQLNARDRNPRVHYSMFVGNGSTFTREQLASLRQLLMKSSEADSFLALMEPALQRALDDFEDSAQPGDGVVSIARSHLEGVTDTTILGFDHWNSVGEPTCECVAALHREILKRLDDQCDSLKISDAR